MAFRTALAPAPRPGLPRLPHGPPVRARPPCTPRETQTPVAAGARPGRRCAAIARLLAEAERPVLVLGSDVWMDRAEEAARDFAEELAAAGHPQRPGPRHPARRARAARHPRPRRRLRPGRPGRRRRHPARLPPRLRLVRRQGRRAARQGRAHRRRAVPARHAHAARPRRPPATCPWCFWSLGTACGDAGRQARRRYAAWVTKLAARPPPRPSPATRACWPPTPTRSTPCASTASWARCWPTTPW